MLLDLAKYVSPRLSIMDAITGMEGEGPGAAGTPLHIGLLIGSRNPLALDVAASEIIGLSRENNPILIAAEKRGLPNRLEDIQIFGPDISDIRIHDYKLPQTLEGVGWTNLAWLQKPMETLAKSGLSQTPQVIKEKCVGCRICMDSCPKKVITMTGKKRKYAHINPTDCIRCYCCHELCPQKAIKLRRNLLSRMIKV